jgi:hypothetical protein
MKDVKIYLISNPNNLEQTFDATVEAEYGSVCVEGSKVTLAHHGERSSNPAPCNTEVEELNDGDTILVSHIDLDALGGIMKLIGEDVDDRAFWEAAEYIDVNGPQHLSKFSKDIQDRILAFDFYNEQNFIGRSNDLIDITDKVKEYVQMAKKIIDEKHPEHETTLNKLLNDIKEREEYKESCEYSRDGNVRSFICEYFCNDKYEDNKTGEIFDATVVLNPTNKSITIAFRDGGQNGKNACEIAQSLWGDKAGGREGIAGSPRDWGNMSEEDLKMEFYRAIQKTQQVLVERDSQNIQFEK